MNNRLTEQLPPLYSANELGSVMTNIPVLPTNLSTEAERLLALNKLYDFFIPNQFIQELYQKMYLGIFRSLSVKDTRVSTLQRNENYRKILQTNARGIIGGSDSLLITGVAGIGKSTAVAETMKLTTNNTIIEQAEPFALVIPALLVQTPFDCSIKALLLQILRKVDELLHTNYYPRTIPTADVLLATTCQVCLNHIGTLIIDEIQNVISHKAGNLLIQCLTELINSSAISIIMVGTTECEQFFESNQFLARRAIELKYNTMAYNDFFKLFCKLLWEYQPLLHPSEIHEADFEWLYEHTAGITSNIISLIHDAQELAIITKEESLNRKLLNQVYVNRMNNLHKFIAPQLYVPSKTSHIPKIITTPKQIDVSTTQHLISDTIKMAKNNSIDYVDCLKSIISVTEVLIK